MRKEERKEEKKKFMENITFSHRHPIMFLKPKSSLIGHNFDARHSRAVRATPGLSIDLDHQWAARPTAPRVAPIFPQCLAVMYLGVGPGRGHSNTVLINRLARFSTSRCLRRFQLQADL